MVKQGVPAMYAFVGKKFLTEDESVVILRVLGFSSRLSNQKIIFTPVRRKKKSIEYQIFTKRLF